MQVNNYMGITYDLCSSISLTRSVEDIHKDQNVVIQEYLDKVSNQSE